MNKVLSLLFCTMLLVGCSQSEVVGSNGTSQEKIQKELNENSFDFLVNKERKFEYNEEDNSLYVEYAVGLPDGTEVTMMLRPSFPDEWGEEYSKHSSLNNWLETDVSLIVSDGKVSYSFGEDEFKSILLPSADYFIVLVVEANENTNHFLTEEFTTEEEFNELYPEIVGTQEKNENNNYYYAFFEDREHFGAFQINVYDYVDAHNLNPIDKVMQSFDNEISYLELEKNPDKYKGTMTKYTGEVLQIQETEVGDTVYNDTVLRLAVNGDFEQVVYVTYNSILGMEEVVKGDMVTIYGEITGSKTYESVAGHQVTIPSIETIVFIED